MGAGDGFMEPCAVRMSWAHVPVVGAVVAVVFAVDALNFSSASCTVAPVLGVLEGGEEVGEFGSVVEGCARLVSGELVRESEYPFAVAALFRMVLVIVAENA